MFPKEVYIKRRNELKRRLGKGMVFLPGNHESPMNYAANQYPFRQDSTFLYYFGIDEPDRAGIIDIDNNNDIIYGNEADLEDIIWMGNLKSLEEISKQAGIGEVKPHHALETDINKAVAEGREIHFLPAYRADIKDELSWLFGKNTKEINSFASVGLIRAVVAQRSVKDAYEIAEMENTMTTVTAPFYHETMRQCVAGKFEYEMAGLMEGMALKNNCSMAYPVICSVNGQILHNHYHGNKMNDGDLLLIDAGAESPLHYATDITRTIPVSGKFTNRQKNIYQLVLKALNESINMIKPGVKYRQVHLNAARIITEGLKDLGLMKGNTDDALANGAHAMFFPHGLGHMIGLDVHDMENLGENYVGYDDSTIRSDQFGIQYLRLAKELKEGYTLTVEPGIYFIPALIEKWKSDHHLSEFYNFEKIYEYIDFGGVRIEDNVLVTAEGRKVLGTPVAKTTDDIENIMKR
ncbi:MAG: aminopeptidase P family protein [Bacteroidales bacterium]|nr:aminopeptidase P family protein [Bacteroidales bacterium]